MCESLNCVPVQIQCDAPGYHNMKSSSSDFGPLEEMHRKEWMQNYACPKLALS